ncbi:MAG: hypothetical protein QXU06_02465 [Candidatus Bathyarchaeia archaeon]
MPYKGLESLPIGEECVGEWASSLRPSTAKSYAYYLLRYLKWAKGRGHWGSAGEMLEEYRRLDPEGRNRHARILAEHLRAMGTGSRDRRAAWYAVKSFYEYHGLQFPRPHRSELSKIFGPSDADKRRAPEMKPLELSEVRQLVLNAPQPYKAAIMVAFQGAMGLAEFMEFNAVGWRRAIERLDEPGPLRIDLYRGKASGLEVRAYYTFIGEDAKALIRDWLAIRPERGPDALFIVFDKRRGEYVPMGGRNLADAITRIAKRIGLIRRSGLGRYHIHAHEFRDLFKSLCTLNGVNPVASEFFLGHRIDRMGYDKSPQYDEGWFRDEYRKVEPLLNVISNPKGLRGEGDLKAAFKRELLLVAGYSEEEVEAMDVANMDDGAVRAKIRERLLGAMANNGARQRVVDLGDVEGYIAQGWEYVGALPNGRAILKLPL